MPNPVTTETVLVEFQTDSAQLDTALDVLERTGTVDKKTADQLKKTNQELQKRQQQINSNAKATQKASNDEKKSIQDLDAAMQQFMTDFLEGWQQGVLDALKDAGIEFDEFGKVVNRGSSTVIKSGKSLKGELRAITQELAAMKLRGEDNTEQYRQLAQRAGEMRDAIGDASNEVRNFASDTSNIDGLISVATGVTGAFSIAQGAVGLFGDENEQLQETLLRVNSAMSILQGLQAVGNVLQKESAAATFLQVTAQRVYNVVIGESIGLMRLFRIALAATGVGILIAGLSFLVEWLGRSSKATKALIADLTSFNDTITAQVDDLNRSLEQSDRIRAENNARLREQGALQSEINKQELEDLSSSLEAIREIERENRSRFETSQLIISQMRTGEIEFNEDALEEAKNFVDSFRQLQNRRLDIANEIRIKSVENEKQIRVEQLQAVADGIEAQLALATKNSANELSLSKQLARAKAAIELEEAGQNLQRRLLIEANLQKQIRELDLNFARVRQEDRIAATERALLAAQQASLRISERTSQEEIDLQKNLIQQKTQLDLLQQGLTENQRTLIVKRGLDEQLKLQRDFNKQSQQQALEDFISTNNAQLQQINLSNDERLRLTEENIIAQAELELQQHVGITAKIKEINAKRDADIKAARLANIQQTLARELELEQARTGVLRRANERLLSNERNTLKVRIAAVNQLAALEIATVNAKQDALERQLRQGLISQEQYNIEYAKLKDEEARITEETELRKEALIRENTQRLILFALDLSQQIISIIAQFGQQQTEAEQIRIDAQRKRVDELRETGAITEREAERRLRRLDAEEAKIKRKQAERDKAIALFQAIINTAAAIVKALPNLVLAGIAAALGGAQIALIASRPIPRFGTGKRSKYEGPGEVGETGTELIERDGKMYVVTKRSLMWVQSDDIIYNPRETAKMLEQPAMANIDLQQPIDSTVEYTQHFDYEKLGKVISKNIPHIGFNVDEYGFTKFVQGQTSFTTYLNKRRGF